MKRGFTLVELLIVISVIVILTALSISAYDLTQKEAEDGAAEALISTIKSGAEKYYTTNNEYPVASAVHGGAVTGSPPANYTAASQYFGIPIANLDGSRFKLTACTPQLAACKTDALTKTRVYYFTKQTQTSTTAEVIGTAAGTGCAYTFAAADTGALGYVLAYWSAMDKQWKIIKSSRGTVTTSNTSTCPFTGL